MGPGRWGSSNIDLGVNVGYADIDNAAVLVEMAREEAGHLPDVSYGTHFFQDLVESSIIFLAVYPDDAATEFNADLFEKSPNALTELLPDAGEFAEAVKVIDVPAVRDGARVHVVADSEGGRRWRFWMRVGGQRGQTKSGPEGSCRRALRARRHPCGPSTSQSR